MSFLYPRVVQIVRPTTTGAVGAVGYGGQTPADEVPVAQDLPAAIQLARESGRPVGGLPADMSRGTYWKVLIPMGAIPAGAIRLRDVVVDDAGVRYAVLGPYLTSLGYNLMTERLET